MSYHVLSIATQVIVMAIVISMILMFIGIGVLVLIRVFVVGRTRRRGDGDINLVERGGFGSTSLSQEDIEKLPCFDFKAKEQGSSPAADCAVCLENFKAGEKCRLLPLCNHSFHAECVDLWLLRTPICPICRTGADFMKSGLLFGEEDDRFSEYGVEFRDGQTTETSPGNGVVIQISNATVGEVGLNQTREIGIGIGIGIASEAVIQRIENQELGNEMTIDVRVQRD